MPEVVVAAVQDPEPVVHAFHVHCMSVSCKRVLLLELWLCRAVLCYMLMCQCGGGDEMLQQSLFGREEEG